MECWPKIIVWKANIIYLAENFYCAEVVMSEAFGKFRNTPPRVTDDVRTGRRKPQTATEKLSHNIGKRWRMGETRRSHWKWYFEFLSTRRKTGVEHGRAVGRLQSPDDGFFYVSLVASARIPVLTGSLFAPVQNIQGVFRK